MFINDMKLLETKLKELPAHTHHMDRATSGAQS
jgi:hypothetical protein